MKVIVTDLDGTLYCDNITMEENKKSADIFRENGNLFIMATGRNLTSLLSVIESFHFTFDYYICNDGAKIYDKDLNIIYESFIDVDVVNRVVSLINDDNCILDWQLDDGINYSKDITSKIVAINAPIVDYNEAKKLLKDVLGDVSEVRGYLSRYYINFLNKVINKSTAIKVLENRLNINKEDIYTIGNDVNDVEMLTDYKGSKMNNSVDAFDVLNIESYESVKDLIEEIS